MDGECDLVVWHRALDLVVESYRLARKLPGDERYGLVSQLRRAAVSVPANIAEGYGRGTVREFLRHLAISSGSLRELQTHIAVAVRLEYLTRQESADAVAITVQVRRMIAALQRSLWQHG